MKNASVSHTPGPWSAIDDGSRSDGLWVSGPSRGEPVICDLVGRLYDHEAQCGQLTGEDVANAHLIAAAPDLLAALKRTVDTIKAWHCLHGDEIGWDIYLQHAPEMQAINAAIAKAKGRS